MKNILPDFQKFLGKKRLVSSTKTPFYAYWVSKFLVFGNHHQDKNIGLRIELFLDSLAKGKKLEDWQIKQADEAIGLYVKHFLVGDAFALSPNEKPLSPAIAYDHKILLTKLREALRIKHYSYRTE
jgi:hypothetical protein